MTETPSLDVICVGEALVDFLPNAPGQRVKDVTLWTRCTGGSPANVAVGVSRLGGSSALVGVVGEDDFGEFLIESLAGEGVDVSHLRQTDEGKTGLCFVSLTEAGDRSFSFHRTRSAELFLSERDVDVDFFQRGKIIHFGTNSLLFREARRAVTKLAKAAHAAGKIVSCDPNLRLHLWPDPLELMAVTEALFPLCTVVKVSEEEAEFVTGQKSPEAALVHLAEKRGVALPVVTLADKGAIFLWHGRIVRVPAPVAKVVDTTGAGDGFTAALLYGLSRLYPDAGALKFGGFGEMRELCNFACAVGTKVTEHLGAVAGLPRAAEVQALLPRFLRPEPQPAE